MSTLSTTRAGGVLEIVLDRPERNNAWTQEMGDEITAALRGADADPETRVVLLTGRGSMFCPGADVDALGHLGPGSKPAPLPAPAALPLMIATPVIAAVNGPCAGIGLVIALSCDVRFASTDALFTTAFARIGLVAEHGSTWLLPRIVGSSRARDLLLSSRRVDAEEAFRIGLVDFLHPPEEMLAAARRYAAEMATRCSPRATASMKASLLADESRSFDAALSAADDGVNDSMSWPDLAEGMRAFSAKRAPVFPGFSTTSEGTIR